MGPRGLLPYAQEPHMSLSWARSIPSVHLPLVICCFIINHFMWWLLMAPEPKLCINPLNAELNPIGHLLALLGAHPILHVSGIRVKHVILYSLLRLVIQFLQNCVSYSFICYGWQAAHLKAFLLWAALRVHMQAENGIWMCVASHIARYSGTLIGYSTDCSQLVSVLPGWSSVRLVTARSAFIFFTCKIDTYRLMKLISQWMYFEPQYYRYEVKEYKFLSIPLRAFSLIPPQIYQLNSHICLHIYHIPPPCFGVLYTRNTGSPPWRWCITHRNM